MSAEVARIPAAHRFARRLAARGWRGARGYWGLARWFASFPPSGLVRLTDDLVVPFERDDWISMNAYKGLYERNEVRVLSRLLHPGETVLDVGANTGYIAAVTASAVSPDGRVLAFEPSPRCLPHLQELARVAPVTVFPIAIGSREGTGFLDHHDSTVHSGLGTLRKSHRGSGEPVKVTTLDAVLESESIEFVDLLKVDVEGFEPEVLEGARRLIAEKRFRVALIEVTPEFGPTTFAAELIAALTDTHAAFEVGDAGVLRKRPMLREIQAGELGDRTRQFNLLIVRRGSEVSVASWVRR